MNDVPSVGELITQGARDAGVTLTKVSAQEADALRQLVAARFAQGRVRWLWEAMCDDVISIRDEYAWTWLGEFQPICETVMFFDLPDDPVMLAFASHVDAVSTLNECPGIEFYLTDRDGTYLLSFNHHDYLTAAGDAREWLRAKVAASGNAE